MTTEPITDAETGETGIVSWQVGDLIDVNEPTGPEVQITWRDTGVGVVAYIMDLEELVRWFALLFSYRVYDDETGEESVEINDPVWAAHDQYGNELVNAQRLQATWRKVMDS
jgi:hypothetical protein